MESLKNVLNSDENLPVDHQMQIIIGNITVPTGSGTIPITRLDNGPQNSIALKRSMLKETIGDNLCLPSSIGRAWLKLYDTVSLAKWKEITQKNLPGMNATMKVIKQENAKELLQTRERLNDNEIQEKYGFNFMHRSKRV